ncbi:hypothetical protein C2845_PM16G02100 [Panicum miliaceum]|uniref:Uncharacterized protein n=1 Tax=Panicum miliaceum TaxID=4540 RepID=A0A3L6Q1H0_PANMI|nr:hypothetical protein C2845_PM16G02100 [Panicum miliaceum]
MRVRVSILTTGIRAVLSCSLNISCSSPSHASFSPQPGAGTPVVPAHPSSPAQTGSSSSEAASSPRSSPPLARHVRRTVLALGRLERAAPAGGRARRGRGTRASGGRGRCDGGGCSACSGCGAQGSTRQHQRLCLCRRQHRRGTQAGEGSSGRAGGAVGSRAPPWARWWQPRRAWTRRRRSWRGRARRPRSRRRRPGRRRSRPLQAARLSLFGPAPWSPQDPGCCQGHWPRRWVAYPHQDQLC